MVNQPQSCDLKDLVQKFIPESIDREIEKTTSSIYPLQNDAGVKMERPAEEPVEAAAEVPSTLLII
ncbi:hypothetical protein CsSME_00028340 [Camellia sinensis var. sinensis]